MNTTLDKFEEIMSSHYNGQTKQWKRQVKSLSRHHRYQLIGYIRDSGNENMAWSIANVIVRGDL